MTDRLFAVEIRYVVVVRAADVDAALKVAGGVDEGDLGDPEIRLLRAINSPGHIPPGWRTGIPFSAGPTGEATVGQLAAEREREVIESGRTHFFGDGCDPPHGVAASQP